MKKRSNMNTNLHYVLVLNRIWLFVSTNGLYISVAISVLLFYFSIMMSVPHSLLADPDTLWHIRTGRWILDHAQVPTVDFYSYTAVGKRWISTEWVAEILLALSFWIGQWRGVVILSALACGVIIAVICFYLVRILRFSVAIGWTALTALAVSPHFLARPHLFGYVIAIIWVIKIVESYDRRDFRSSIPYFCLLMVLWANLHPSFTFGLALFYVFVGYSCCEKLLRRDYLRCKDELLTLTAVTVCALLTPYGIFSALLTLEAINMKIAMQNISEWRPPDFQQNRIQLFLIVGFLMAMTGLGVRLRGPRLIVYGLILILGLSYTRGLVMFYLLTPIILARPVSERAAWFRKAQRERIQSSEAVDSGRVANSVDPVLLYLQKGSVMIPAVCLAGAIFVTAVSWRQIGDGPPDQVAPRAAIDFVKREGITGNVFNSYIFGGYLIFKGIPTFIDGRQPPYTDKFLREYFDTIRLADIKGAFQLLDQYKVKWVLLQPTDPLAKALAEGDQWNEVYTDKYSAVLVRSR